MWKGVLFFLVSSVIILMGLYSVTRIPLTVHGQKEPFPIEINYDSRVQKENAGIPSYIKIPSLYLYADAEVGATEASRLLKPKSSDHVSFLLDKNTMLGKKGVIIFAGDFDRENGRPGIFYNLAALQKADVIQVTDLNGKVYQYLVTQKGEYNWDATEVTSLFKKTDRSQIILIMYPPYTEENRKRPERNTVIYAEMK